MKKHIHPDYRPVVYRDADAGLAFLTRSTARTDQILLWDDGNTYPVVDVEISAASHPFYTGRTRILDSAGQVEKFRRRYSAR